MPPLAVTALFEVYDYVAVEELLSGLDVDRLDDAGPFGAQALPHLHGLENTDLVAGDHLVARLDRD